MASIALSPARALRRPRHLDLRAVLGFLLLLVAIAGSVAFWSASSGTQAVIVATRNLAVGTTLSAGELAVARVRVDPSIYRQTVPATALGMLIGKQVNEPVHADELLIWPQISSGPLLGHGRMALTIPVSADTAVGGHIRPGDVVEVLVTTGRSTAQVRTAVVLPRVTVFDVGYQAGAVVNTAGSAPGTSTGPISWVTLVATQSQAIRLAQARWAGQLDVALLAGQ
jgi:pilus assembly protein CpaB